MLVLSLFLIYLHSTEASSFRRQSSVPLPVLDIDFADPAAINVNGTWFAFATNTNGSNVPVAQADFKDDLSTWTVLPDDALPTVGNWSNSAAVWAPDVIQLVRLKLSWPIVQDAD